MVRPKRIFYEEPILITMGMSGMLEFERLFNKYKLRWIIVESDKYSLALNQEFYVSYQAMLKFLAL